MVNHQHHHFTFFSSPFFSNILSFGQSALIITYHHLNHWVPSFLLKNILHSFSLNLLPWDFFTFLTTFNPFFNNSGFQPGFGLFFSPLNTVGGNFPLCFTLFTTGLGTHRGGVNLFPHRRGFWPTNFFWINLLIKQILPSP